MLETASVAIYKAFGLKMASDILMPELPLMTEEQEDTPEDVVIEIADLTPLWNRLASEQSKVVARENFLMFQIQETAIFSVQDGKKIIVSPFEGADEAKIRLFILGTCMGAVLLQKRILPLHGSAIAVDGKAYAFVGVSGAGKSTLASTLLGKGQKLISDDLIAVTLSDNHIPMVMPAYPQQKLWQESLNEFGMDTSRFKSVFERESKYLVPVPSKFVAKPLPLAGVFELSERFSEEIQIKPIQGLSRLHTLFNHTFRKSLLHSFGLLEWHFGTIAAISNQIELYQLCRPRAGFTAPEVAALILKTIHKEKQEND
jgi:hypothetical protein